MATKVRKRLKLKEPYLSILRFIGFLLLALVALFLFYRHEVNGIKKLGYSEKSSNKILFSFYRKYVNSINYSKTLDKAYSSKYFKEKYMKKYEHIDYVDGKHFIKNINILLDKKYSYNDINMIFAHGSDSDVSEFAKRDRVNYLEEYYSYDFAKIKNYDKYVKYSDESGEGAYSTIVRVNLKLDEENYKDPIIVSKFSTNMLVNKHYKLSDKFSVPDLVKLDDDLVSENGIKLQKEAYNAFKNMYNDASKSGYSIYINAGYRSSKDQQELCDLYKRTYGEEYVKKYVALPGFSEHETGLSIDVASKNSKIFAESKEYRWMLDNAYKYGFILRYTANHMDDTGFRPEAWHYRYVGKDISAYLHDHNISYEEYYAVFVDK